VGICDTTFTGAPIHPEVRAAVEAAGRLLESLGHTVSPCLPRADVAMMMEAWTDIVACGTALGIRKALKGRAPEGLVEPVSLGAMRRAAEIPGERYLEAVGQIHAFGRQMAAVFDPETGEGIDILLSATLAEPPARVGRFAHGTEGVFAYSPFTAVFNASGQPAASLPLGMSAGGLPIGVHLAARFGADEELIALCAEIERAAPWIGRRPAPLVERLRAPLISRPGAA
jgi:amidase/6-aminohexanoate-cyclic-dimer hydrolase